MSKSSTPTLRIFTKPDCPHCARAKRALAERGLDHVEHDVERDIERDEAAASVYHSGSPTVPQIFVGDHHLGGADELEAVLEADLLASLLRSVSGELVVEGSESLRAGAEDLPLRTHIPPLDGSRDDDPESWPLLEFYRRFFGFWPNCFGYMRRWPEAYKLFVYAHNIGAITLGRERLGEPLMIAVSYATSSAQGCDYCRIHTAAIGGERSLAAVAAYEAGRRQDADVGPFGPFERGLAELGADAARNSVDASALPRLRALASQARRPVGEVQDWIDATAMIAAAFGFLNTFNELTGVAIEGGWAQAAHEGLGLEAGRHDGGETQNPDNLPVSAPREHADGPTMEEVIASYEDRVGDLDAYLQRELGFVPAWIRSWPEQLRRRHAHLYVELMSERPHARLSAELRHLMARVSAIAKGHDELAASEALLAHRAGPGGEQGRARIERCYAAARGRSSDHFSPRERAALTLAWLSAQTPLITPRRFVAPVLEHYGPDELVQLISVCGLAALVQRFAAIAKPGLAPEVEEFLARERLESRTVALRHDLSGELAGS